MIKKLTSSLFAKKILPLLFFCALLTLSACKKDTSDDIQTSMLAEWYSQNVSTKTSSNFKSMKPLWESTYIIKQNGLNVYEVNLSNSQNLFQRLDEKLTAKEALSRNNIKLLIFQDNENGKIITGCYMSIVNQGAEILDLKKIHYKQKNGLTGKIMFYNINGNLENGWGYSNGIIDHRLNGTLEGFNYYGSKQLPDLANPALIEARNSGLEKLMTLQPPPCLTPQPVYGTSCVGTGVYMECSQYISGYTCPDEPTGGGGEGDDGGYNPYPTPPGHGGGGGGGGSQNTPLIAIKKDSIATKFPCMKALVLDELEKISGYNKLVLPFIDGTKKPDLTWNSAIQPWGNGTFSAGTTGISPSSNTGMSSDINLNSAMIQNGSKLLIAATTIHETYHAYINYLFASNGNVNLFDESKPNYMAGLYQYIIYERSGGSNNYTDHYNMLTSQFDNFTTILFEYGKGTYSLEECRKALLFGMNNAGAGASQSQTEFINQAYSDLLTKYGYTATVMNAFNLQQVNAPANKRLPTTGCL